MMKVLIPHTYPGTKFGIAQVDDDLETISPCCGARLVNSAYGSPYVECTRCKENHTRAFFKNINKDPVVFDRGLSAGSHIVEEWIKLWTGLEDVEVRIT